MDSSNKIIIAIKEHNQLGYVFAAYEVVKNNEEYYSVVSQISSIDLKHSNIEYSDSLTQVITLIDKYSDQNIYKFYNSNKKNSISDFFSNIDNQLKTNLIRPFIEKVMLKIYEILKQNPDIEVYYKNKNYENIYISDLCKISPLKAKTIFNFERHPNGLKYWLSVYHKDHEIVIFHKKPIIISNNPAIIELEHIIMCVEDTDAKKLQPFYENEFINVPKNVELKYFHNFVLKTIAHNQVKAIGFEIKSIVLQPQPIIFLEHDIKGRFVLLLKFKYIKYLINFDQTAKAFVEFDENTFCVTKYHRDKQFENKIIKELLSLGLEQTDSNSFITNNFDKNNQNQHFETISWINQSINKIKELNISVEQNFTEKKYYLDEVNLNIKIEDKIDWFDINGYAKFGEYTISFLKLREYILNGKREIELENGQIAVIPESWYSKYGQVLKFTKKTPENTLKVSKIHFIAFHPQNNGNQLDNFSVSNFNDFFKNPLKNNYPLPQNLKSQLRNYQQIGYNWLLNLSDLNLGGILADDMGLGKTVQILTVLQKIVEDNTNKKSNLIIVPRSLLHNWQNEIHKHTNINSLIYFGNDRLPLRSFFKQKQIIITSYGIARNDIEFFKQIEFNYLILDESQYIKNSKSKTYLALKQFVAQKRLSLTGTPIENSLKDLWSQMNFVNTGLLGSPTFFKKNFIIPIEKHKCSKTKEQLRKLIAPFILRRTKKEVIKDLPEHLAHTIICEMTPEQKHIYEQEKSKIRNKIYELYAQKKLNESKFFILQALTRLRQIANHPALLFKNYVYSSGKFDEIVNRLETLLKENHKVLIFSTFVTLLEILEKYIKDRDIPYKMLTGQSQNRQEIVDSFEKDTNINIFLLSIKAGGYGLNLVSADYVFIVDPWWNPAVEQQAIARAHRIGQTRNVFSYRFITYGTVEEKIQMLQSKKMELSNDFIETNNYFKYFNNEEIVEIFA